MGGCCEWVVVIVAMVGALSLSWWVRRRHCGVWLWWVRLLAIDDNLLTQGTKGAFDRVASKDERRNYL